VHKRTIRHNNKNASITLLNRNTTIYTYRRLEECIQSFNFRHHSMLIKERQVPTALLPEEVSIVPIALCRLCGVRYIQHAVGKSKISLRPGKKNLQSMAVLPTAYSLYSSYLFCQIRFCPTV
jgi:hypothetical protein